jgi:hypothetical protein
MIFAIPADAADLPPSLAEKRAVGDAGAAPAVAYVCTGTTCAAPITDLDEIKRALPVP